MESLAGIVEGSARGVPGTAARDRPGHDRGKMLAGGIFWVGFARRFRLLPEMVRRAGRCLRLRRLRAEPLTRGTLEAKS